MPTKSRKELVIDKIIKDFAGVHVHARNFKDWFVDIYDVEIEDSNGHEVSIDYPDNQFSIENYEKEIEKCIKSYLQEKFSIDADDVVVLLDEYIQPED